MYGFGRPFLSVSRASTPFSSNCFSHLKTDALNPAARLLAWNDYPHGHCHYHKEPDEKNPAYV